MTNGLPLVVEDTSETPQILSENLNYLHNLITEDDTRRPKTISMQNCYKNNRLGHNPGDSPNPKLWSDFYRDIQNELCTFCGMHGHHATECHQNSGNQHKRAEDMLKLTRDGYIPRGELAGCWRCGQPGHQSRECTNPKKSEFNCWKCGQYGHFGKDCGASEGAVALRDRAEEVKMYGVGTKLFVKGYPSYYKEFD
jgi:hypothetical protein